MRLAARTVFLPLAILALGLGACDDATELEAHPDAEGVAILADGSEIYRYMLDDGLPLELALDVGLYDVAIVLLDHDGQPLAHEEGEEEEELQVTITDTDVLTWTPEADTGEPHEVLEFHGTLEALQAGDTSMTICLLHEGHCDFDAEIPVAVTQ